MAIKDIGGIARCHWCGDDALYMAYHDKEWGRSLTDDIRLFEKISLEGFQSGLSWITILRKRENFRRAFAGFDFEKIISFGDQDIERLMGDSGIIRHRGKIEAVINNAGRAIKLIEEYGALKNYLRDFLPAARGSAPRYPLPAKTPESIALSKDLRARGFKFVGPTTIYAFMQSVGMVNDHFEGCPARAACDDAYAAFF